MSMNIGTSIDALTIRRTLGKDGWLVPQPFGPDGWSLSSRDNLSSVLATCAEHDGIDWVHASIAHVDQTPTYADLVALHHAVWRRRGWAYQVFAPPVDHVNIHEHALHLWGRLDGSPVLPNFGQFGSI